MPEASPRQYIEARVGERVVHTTAEQVETTCSFARAERLLGREYHGRFLIELLQNASDAWRKGAEPGRRSRVKVLIAPGPSLVVANQGDPFPADVVIQSLGHIGRSTKPRGEAIGHKGIGFKSVLELSLTPQLYSGMHSSTIDLAVRFDPQAALEQVRGASPEWDQLTSGIEDVAEDATLAIPVLRYPQWVDEPPGVVLELAREGFDTVVILPFDERFAGRLGLDEARWLELVRDALSDVTDQILLLLGTFDEVVTDDRLLGSTTVIEPRWDAAVALGDATQRESVEVSRDATPTSRWRLYRRELPGADGLSSEIAVGMRLDLDQDSPALVPPLGDEASAPFHLFFPTKIGSGLPFLLHGYFEVDAARTGFYEGSTEENESILRELASLVANAVADTATTRALDLTSLVELLAAAAQPEDAHARVFQRTALNLLDHIEWVPLDDTSGSAAAAEPVRVLCHAQPELIARVARTFSSAYVKRITGLDVPTPRISAAGLAFLASRRPPESPDLWDLLAALLRPGDTVPWSAGHEDEGFRMLLDLVGALDGWNRPATERMLADLRGDGASRLLPVVAGANERALVPLPDPAGGVAGSRSLLVMARVRAPGASPLVPPKQLDVAFLPDGLLESEAEVDRAKPLGVRPFTVDNVIDRLTDLSTDPSQAEEMVRFVWALLARDTRSEYSAHTSSQHAESFDPGRWFWCQPGRAESSDSERDRQRREHLLATVPLPSRDGSWRPAGSLAFGATWADWLEAGALGPLTPAVRTRADAYRLLEQLHPSDAVMVADPAVVLPLLEGQRAEDQEDAGDGTEGPSPEAADAARHAFLLRLGVWEVLPVEAYENRATRDRARFPWKGRLQEMQARLIDERGGWTFDRHRWSGVSHQSVYVAEDFRFQWSLADRAQCDPIALARLLDLGVELYGKLTSLSVFCPGCANNSTRHQPTYKSHPHDGYPSSLLVELRSEPWVPAVRHGKECPSPLPSADVWWSQRVPSGAGLMQSPLRYLTLSHPEASIGSKLRDLAAIHELDSADSSEVGRLLRTLRDEFEGDQLPADPLESSSARQAFIGLHRVAYERLAEITQSHFEVVRNLLDDVGVLCEVADIIEYRKPPEARHDDGKFAAYRRYFAAVVPFVVLPRNRSASAERLGVKTFTVSLTRRGADEGRDVTDELAEALGDRIAELLAIVVHHSLGTQTLEPTSQQFEERARRLRNLRIRQVDRLVIDAVVEGLDLTATIGERDEQDVFLEGPTSPSPVLFHDFVGEGWQDRVRRKLAPQLATILENPAYSATFALFLLADDDAEREAALQELGISAGDVDGIKARVGAVSDEDRRRAQRWFQAVLTAGADGDIEKIAVDMAADALTDALRTSGFTDADAARLVELGGGSSVRSDASQDGALAVLVANNVDIQELDARLREMGDEGIELRVARTRLRQWVNAYGRRVAAVLATRRPADEAKAAVAWDPPPALTFALDPPLIELLAPVLATLRAAGFQPHADRLARGPEAELTELAGLSSSGELDALVGPLYDEEERERMLRASAASWRRELMLLATVARSTAADPRAAIRAHAATMDEMLPANPRRPSDLAPALEILFAAHPALQAALGPLLADSYVAAAPDRTALFAVARSHDLEIDHLDAVLRALEAPRRDAARQTRDRVQKLVEQKLEVKVPPGLRPAEPPTPKPRAQRKSVSPVKVGESSDRRKRQLGDEGERWALAAAVQPFLTMSPTERRTVIDEILVLLDEFEGSPVEAVRAHAEPACAADLDDDELIDELTALLHVSRYSDGFGFDLLAWLASTPESTPVAMCVEVKSSRDGAFFFSAGEWSVATRFNDNEDPDRYAVLVVRRAATSGPPAGFDLLADPVELVRRGILTKADDGYKLSYRSD